LNKNKYKHKRNKKGTENKKGKRKENKIKRNKKQKTEEKKANWADQAGSYRARGVCGAR
jgi:hypothetical protein